MKILVTGGAGFIGSNFLQYMTNKYPNYKFFCLDALTYAGNLENLSSIMGFKNFNFIEGNILDKQLLDKIFKTNRFDKVVNFAAESDVDKSIENPEIFLQTNIIGTKNLLDVCLKYNVSHFHQISTDEVYGDLFSNKDEISSTEVSSIRPSNPYAVSKASADMLVLSYVRTYNLYATISRCSNNYGPYQHVEKLIPMIIINSLKNKSIEIHGTGEAIRDWIYVKDHIEAIDMILKSGKSGNIYNIGSGCKKSVLEVSFEILKKMNKSKSMIIYKTDRKGQDLKYAINTKKISEELGWKPKVDFDQGITSTIEWYSQNEKWIESIKI